MRFEKHAGRAGRLCGGSGDKRSPGNWRGLGRSWSKIDRQKHRKRKEARKAGKGRERGLLRLCWSISTGHSLSLLGSSIHGQITLTMSLLAWQATKLVKLFVFLRPLDCDLHLDSSLFTCLTAGMRRLSEAMKKYLQRFLWRQRPAPLLPLQARPAIASALFSFLPSSCPRLSSPVPVAPSPSGFRAACRHATSDCGARC